MIKFDNDSPYEGVFRTEKDVLDFLHKEPHRCFSILNGIDVQTPSICHVAIYINPWALGNIRGEYQTDSVIKEALRVDLRVFRDIVNPTNDHIQYAIERAADLPSRDQHEVKALLLTAIKEHCPSAEYYVSLIETLGAVDTYQIPREHLTDDVALALVRANPHSFTALIGTIDHNMVMRLTELPVDDFKVWRLIDSIMMYNYHHNDSVVYNILRNWPRKDYPRPFLEFIESDEKYHKYYNKMKLVNGE